MKPLFKESEIREKYKEYIISKSDTHMFLSTIGEMLMFSSTGIIIKDKDNNEEELFEFCLSDSEKRLTRDVKKIL